MGCNRCPAFAKCDNTYRGSGCVALRETYRVYSDPAIFTVADKIRASSDEDLAGYIVKQITECVGEIYQSDLTSNQDFISRMKKTILAKLQQDANY